MTVTTPGNFDSQTYTGTLFAQVYNFGPDHTQRVTRYSNCWDFYNGKHWSVNTPEGFDQVTVNYCKKFVQKLRRFAFRNDWNLVFTKEQREDGIEQWVTDVWKNNDLHDITTRLAEFGGIFGDWFLYPSWTPKEEVKEGETLASQVKLSIIDPRYAFPQYNNKTGDIDFMVILVPYEKYEFINGNFEASNRVYREVHTAESIYVMETDENNNELSSTVLPNPINKVLVVHGINQPKAGRHFGQGVVEDLIGTQKLFNEKVSDISDILDYHAAPITIIFGAKAKQLEKGANKLWSGLPYQSKVENLSSEGNIKEASEFIHTVKTWMHELSDVCEDSLGSSREISNTSAVALSIEYEPMIEVADDMRYYFAKGITEINKRIIDIGIYLGEINTNLKGSDLYSHDVIFGDLLPRDRQAELTAVISELSNGLEDGEGALTRLGVKDAKTKLEEIRKWKEEDMKFKFELNQKYMPPEVANEGEENSYGKTDEKTPQEKKARKAANKNPVVHGEQVHAEAVKAKK